MKWFVFQLIFAIFELCTHVKPECLPKNVKDTVSANLIKQLEPLKGHMFSDKQKDVKISAEFEYTLRICEGVATDDFKSPIAGVIQRRVDIQDQHTPKIIGSINSTVVKAGTDWIMLTYRHGDAYGNHCKRGRRQAHIMIVCDPSQLMGDFKVLYEHNIEDEESDCFYLMELPSSVACSKQPGLSSGSIFLIIFFTFVLTYLIIGSMYMRCVYGSKGWDQIPNSGFWKSFGNLQSDGCNFLCRCSGSGYSSSRPYQGIADDQLEEENDDEHLLPM